MATPPASFRVLSLAGGGYLGLQLARRRRRVGRVRRASLQQHVQAMLEDRLGGRYLRLDADWPAQGGLGIDIATPQAARLLLSLAKGTLRGAPLQSLWPFFDPVAANAGAQAARAAG